MRGRRDNKTKEGLKTSQTERVGERESRRERESERERVGEGERERERMGVKKEVDKNIESY